MKSDDKIKLIGCVFFILAASALYYQHQQLINTRAKLGVSNTAGKAAVLDSKFKDAVSKDKELKNKVIVPKDEDADKFWDRVLK